MVTVGDLAHSVLTATPSSIIERGSHEELVVKGGRYAKLFNLQAQGYR